MTLASTVESHVNDVISDLVRSSRIDATPFGSALLSHAADDLTANWPKRHAWLGSAFGVAISGTSAANKFDTLVKLRNAIAHGSGGLTAKQTKSLEDRLALEGALGSVLGVVVSGERFHFSGTTRRSAHNVARDYVLEFDALIRHRD